MFKRLTSKSGGDASIHAHVQICLPVSIGHWDIRAARFCFETARAANLYCTVGMMLGLHARVNTTC